MSGTNPIATELAKWAKEQMKFRCFVSKEDRQVVSEILPACKGSVMVLLWEKVTREVRPLLVAEEMRSNIELEELVEENEEHKAKEDERQRNLKSIEADIESLELQLKSYKEDLQKERLNLAAASKRNHYTQMKLHMHQNHAENLKQKNESLSSFRKWLTEICDAHRNTATAEISDKDIDNCQKDADVICKLMSRGGSHNFVDAYPKIGNFIKKYSPNLIVKTLTQMSQSSAEKINAEEDEIDFLRDIKQLEESYLETDHYTDPNKLATIQNMLHQWDLECVQSHNACLMCERNSRMMLRQIKMERDTITTHYRNVYEFEPSVLQLNIDNLDAEIELASMEGGVRSFRASAARLQREILTKTKTRDSLIDTKKRIDGFTEIMTENQNQIISITKRNSALKSKLTSRQKHIQETARREICDKFPELHQSCSNVQSAIKQRFTAFTHCDMGSLLRLNFAEETMPVQHLSINRYLNTAHYFGGQSYQKVVQDVKVHAHRSPSAIMQKIIETKQHISRAESLEDGSVTFAESENLCQKLKELYIEGNKVENTLIDSATAKYNSGVKILEGAFLRCDALNKMGDVWFDQPAQHQVPWVRYNGMNLEEWRTAENT